MQRILKCNPVYLVNGKNENEFDCWKFTRLVQKELFDRELPFIQLDVDDSIRTWIRLVVQYKQQLKWESIDFPLHGCIVEMSHAERPYHVGTWLDLYGGGVFHCTRGAGISFSTIREMKIAGWNRFVYDIPPTQ